ncbi:hypothetical protein D3C86_1361220 [compost metagenome]
MSFIKDSFARFQEAATDQKLSQRGFGPNRDEPSLLKEADAKYRSSKLYSALDKMDIILLPHEYAEASKIPAVATV